MFSSLGREGSPGELVSESWKQAPGLSSLKPERQDLGAGRGVGDRGSGCLMPRCDRGDEGTALICLALILQAVVVVECKSQDMMETGSSTRHL